MITETVRYSDEELAEFKVILTDKLSVANKELDYLRDSISTKTETEGQDLKNLGAETEKLIILRDRQSVFVSDLEIALSRIEDKTYGTCKVTGKLIDKDRLRAIPLTTLSAEAKKAQTSDKSEEPRPAKKEKKKPVQKIQRCRVCGCTQDNCQQCIDKTGGPCHWVEEDLCSACETKSEEPAQLPPPAQNDITDYNERILKEKLKSNDMNFFTQLNELVPGVAMSIKIKEKNGKYTFSVLPGVDTQTTFQPLVGNGTPEELDEKFFEMIKRPLQDAAASLKNAEEFTNNVQATAKEKQPAAATSKKPETKKPADKKATAKKGADKKDKSKAGEKESNKTPEPDLFAAAE